MTKSSALVKLVSLVLVSLLMNSPHCGATPCSDVDNDLYPCLDYVIFGGQVSSECCGGVENMVIEANTQKDRQDVCSCLKVFISSANDEEIQRAATIPGRCGIPIPFNITRDVDCSKVN